MVYLTYDEIIKLHHTAITLHGGDWGIADDKKIKSAIGQPLQTFDDEDLYPTLIEKAAALAFFLNQGHGFVDGNKRTAQAAMEMLLARNGYEIYADMDEQRDAFLDVASGKLSREDFTKWLDNVVIEAVV